MKCYLKKEEDYNTSKWMGGLTKELSIYPKDSKYLERNFIWRISSATVDVEESDFSKLPDYDRVLMVQTGEVVLSYEGHRVIRLKELEQDRFDGGWKTKSFGKITDFNLMTRKGNEGYLDLIYPQKEIAHMSSTYESELPMSTHALYCKEGYIIVSAGKEEHMVRQGQIFVMEYEENEKVQYDVMGEGVTIRAQIFYNQMKDELYPVEIPKEKATFDDFKKCVFLANVQFRWAEYIVKKLKDTWLDEALSSVIKKLEKYYVTSVVFLIGMIILLVPAVELGWEPLKIFVAFCVWAIIDMLLVSPLIYFIFVPKPVAKHIKDINKLTPYEQKVRERELAQNERLDKLMKKYKNSGKKAKKED